MSCLCYHADHLYKRRMMIVVFILQKKILPVHSQGILGQVIGSKAQKIHTFSKFFTDHDRCRCFDHNSGTDVFVRNILLIQALFYLTDQLLDLIQLILGRDHRIHQVDISIGTCTVNSPKLRFKHFFAIKAETDAAVSHHRIDLIRNCHIFCLTVCPQVHGTDHCRTFIHILGYFFIGTEQLILSWIILSSEILEFTSKKADTCCSVIKNRIQIIQISDVCQKLDLLAIGCDILLVPKSQKFFPLFLICCMTDLIFLKKLRLRIDIQCSCIPIYNSHMAIPFFLYLHLDQGGDFHGFCHDRYMGNNRPLMHDYRQKTGFVHLQKFIGGKLLCCKDHRLISQIDPCMGATHGADQQLGDLPDIFDLFFDSLVLQLAEHICKLIPGCLDCVSCTDLFCRDHAFYGPLEAAAT